MLCGGVVVLWWWCPSDGRSVICRAIVALLSRPIGWWCCCGCNLNCDDYDAADSGVPNETPSVSYSSPLPHYYSQWWSGH
jgi:hypothetical protein